MLGIKEGAKKPATLESLKRHAKAVKKARNITYTNALEDTAHHFGWGSYTHAHRELS